MILHKTVVNMRKMLGFIDRKIDDEIMSDIERQMKTVLLDLGIPEKEIKFNRELSGSGFTTSFCRFEWDTRKWLGYDTAILHPWCEVWDPNTIAITNIFGEVIDGIFFRGYLSLHVTLPPYEKETLINIGKISVESETTQREYVSCN